MNAENKKIDAEMIGKYLAGEATPEEAMLLQDWLAHQENQEEFEHYSRLWNLMPASIPATVPSSQEVWSQLQSNIDKKRRSAPVRRILIRLSVAASIIAVVVILAIYFLNQRNSSPLNKNEITLVRHEAADEKRTDTLKDGSVITINKHSNISYGPEFNNVKRELTMSGEAFFNVVPDKSKPFIISLDDLKVEVVGTSFNVSRLPLTNEIEVQVQTGIVKMYTNASLLMVKKGQTGIYTKKDGTLKLKDTIDVNSIGYATNSFYFNDISLIEACKYLSHAFNVDIRIDQEKFRDCRVTAQFQSKSLSYILEVINATFSTTYKKEGNTIQIQGNGCQ